MANPEPVALAWETLQDYHYEPGLNGLPDAVKAMNGRSVHVRGYLLPLYEFEDIHEFVLTPRHPGTFGIPASVSSQVLIHIKSKHGLENTTEALEVTGTFHAVERNESGFVLSIFQIDDAGAVAAN